MNRPRNPSPASASAFYRQEWQRLRRPDADPESLRRLAGRIALAFLDNHYYMDWFDDDAIHVLCDMGTFFEDEARQRLAASAIFGTIIERLCDDFEHLQAEAYNRVISRVISFCRHVPGGEPLDGALRAFGLHGFDDLLHRGQHVRRDAQRPFQAAAPVEKVFVLSRVTVGADVAITSVLVQRLADRFPGARIVLVGGSNLEELFGANAALRLKAVQYPRRGALLSRFAGWQKVLEAIGEELAATAPEHTILVDPDSRLSQLGILPVAPPDTYFFLNSRADEDEAAAMAMSDLANHWADAVFGRTGFRHPRLWLPAALESAAGAWADGLRRAGCRRLVCVALGVGENERKRVGGDFEERLLRALLAEPRTVVLLDKGAGPEEGRRIGALVEAIRRRGPAVCEATFGSLGGVRMAEGLVAVETSIGQIAALIAPCDEFIGYDSACQHMAAALGVTCYTVFAGTNSSRFVRRWRARGPGSAHVIHVDTLSHPQAVDTEEVVARILDRRSQWHPRQGPATDRANGQHAGK